MLGSWVTVQENSHFPIQNLPYGIFSSKLTPRARPGVAIGDYVLDLRAAAKLEGLSETKAAQLGCFSQTTLNDFMSLDKEDWHAVRQALTELLRADNPLVRDNSSLRKELLFPMDEVTMHLPARIGDYTDFYCCEEHARNAAGFRTGIRGLSSSWLKLPVAYHSRSSSVVVSGTDIRRPRGQTGIKAAGNAVFSLVRSFWSSAGPETEERASKNLDYELEMAVLIGPGNKLGEKIPVNAAEDHIFGVVLLNDWSARDLQWFEMFPLGPFNAKNFATTISPWVVTLDALKEFKKAAPEQQAILPYLQERSRGLYDITLMASIQPEGQPSTEVSKTNFQQLHWTPQQMIAHHTVGGCNLQPGDLLGTGTISSPGLGGQGCLLELSGGGTKKVSLQGGQERTYLEDGDTVTLSGYCQADGYRIGFGECRGKVLPAV